jgi:predicted DNA-binding ribbon-helix-helix protein
MWDALHEIAAKQEMSVNQLVTLIESDLRDPGPYRRVFWSTARNG